jgi:hypothetical protein
MSNLYNFIKGDIANNYTVPEERGFLIQGNVGSLLNTNDNHLKSIQQGLMINRVNKTNDSETFINKIHPAKADWEVGDVMQPATPMKYCQNNIVQSELLPNYPNGVKNNVLSPTCDLTLGNVGSPTLYGASTFGINDPNVINNACNNIGHEIETYGEANMYGSRALGQGKSAVQGLQAGYNVPDLYTNKVKGAYITKPGTFNKDVPLYQVGDWTTIPGNFLYNFNNNQQC